MGVACRDLWLDEWAVENSAPVQAIRTANGMETEVDDVWQGIDDPERIAEHDVLWASPPCQTFSMAGKGAGRAAFETVMRLVEERAFLRPADMRAFGAEHDERTALVLTPMTFIYDHMPRAIVLEQVPTVLPLWQAFEPILRMMGYSTVSGNLQAEQYGVPQTRKRAILVARLDGPAKMPTPTHSRFYPREPKRLDSGVLPWRSMAEALGWGMTERPYVSVAAGTEAGGTDPAALGGSGARKIVHTERDAERWQEPLEGRDRPRVSGVATTENVWHERPATTVASSDVIAGPGWSDPVKGGVSRQNRPGSVRVTVEEAAALQSFPADFVWPETVGKGAKMQTIGNAVPPLLARALLLEVTS